MHTWADAVDSDALTRIAITAKLIKQTILHLTKRRTRCQLGGTITVHVMPRHRYALMNLTMYHGRNCCKQDEIQHDRSGGSGMIGNDFNPLQCKLSECSVTNLRQQFSTQNGQVGTDPQMTVGKQLCSLYILSLKPWEGMHTWCRGIPSNLIL